MSLKQNNTIVSYFIYLEKPYIWKFIKDGQKKKKKLD